MKSWIDQWIEIANTDGDSSSYSYSSTMEERVIVDPEKYDIIEKPSYKLKRLKEELEEIEDSINNKETVVKIITEAVSELQQKKLKTKEEIKELEEQEEE